MPSAAAESPFVRIHHFVEAQAARTPEACAVLHGKVRLSYRDLNERANRVARHLQSLGVGPEVIVSICLERSAGAIVSVLAVLKAGGAYLPLDPAYPAERLIYMLENSRSALLITEPEVWRDRPCPARKLALREIEKETEKGACELPRDEGSGAEDPLAYVIYTSGSTGKPKGVAVPHVPACHLIRWHAGNMPVSLGTRVLQLAPLSFDVSFQEIFATLSEGGTLVLIDEAVRRDPQGLRQLLAERRVNRLFLTPVLLYRLAELAGPPLPELRDVTAAGEQLRITPAVIRFFGEHPGATLRNQYGPTETTVITHSHTLTGPPDTWPLLPPLGHTIEGVRPYLLDAERRPVSAGGSGELYFGGTSVSRGYLHDPERTAAAFLPDPARPGARIYRSGDLAQRNADGTWQFLGRADDQVKVRGFRIELGEIEAVLARHPAVEQAAVGASEPTVSGDRELIAGYVLRSPGGAPSATEMRGWLRAQLPDYFVPTRLAALERFPVTPSGKLDRRTLVGIVREEFAREQDLPVVKRPKEGAEGVIAEAWKQVLGRGSIGAEDNFFDAGGNSISAVRVHTMICERMAEDFPITAFFQRPTIRALAAYLADRHNPGMSKVNDAQERARRQRAAMGQRAPAKSELRG